MARVRYNWKAIMGEPLTHIIYRMKMKKSSKYDTYVEIYHNPQLQEYFAKYPQYRESMRQNIVKSIEARYAENNSALRVYRDLNGTR